MAAAAVFLIKLAFGVAGAFILVQLILHPWTTLKRAWGVLEALGTLLELLP